MATPTSPTHIGFDTSTPRPALDSPLTQLSVKYHLKSTLLDQSSMDQCFFVHLADPRKIQLAPFVYKSGVNIKCVKCMCLPFVWSCVHLLASCHRLNRIQMRIDSMMMIHLGRQCFATFFKRCLQSQPYITFCGRQCFAKSFKRYLRQSAPPTHCQTDSAFSQRFPQFYR